MNTDDIGAALHHKLVENFVAESNRIEGILETTSEQVDATLVFLARPAVTVCDLEQLVEVYQPGARLRTQRGMDVRVGDHRPPPGGSQVVSDLEQILKIMLHKHPYATHIDYETLHPFMDGNGRSGRTLWAWHMLKKGTWPGLKLGFLHAWYYQSLQFSRR